MQLITDGIVSKETNCGAASVGSETQNMDLSTELTR